VVHVGKKIQSANRGILEHKGRTYEFVVLESRRRIASIYQLTVLEGTAMESAAGQFDSLVAEGLVDMVHYSVPRIVSTV
jgi:hypothetical protein